MYVPPVQFAQMPGLAPPQEKDLVPGGQLAHAIQEEKPTPVAYVPIAQGIH